MINKNKYREYLINRMERQTPVLSEAAGVNLSTPAMPIRPLHPIRHWLMPTLASLLGIAVAFFGIVGIDEWIHAPKAQWVMSLEERNYMASRVYNTIVKDDESLPMADDTRYDKSWDKEGPGQLDFLYITILDAVTFKTSYDDDLHPFFDETIRNQPVDTVVALLKFTISVKNGIKSSAIQQMIFLNFAEYTLGFLGGEMVDESDLTDFSIEPTIEAYNNNFSYGHESCYSSNYFLIANGIRHGSEAEGGSIDITLTGPDKEGFAISAVRQVRDPTTKVYSYVPIPCSIDNSNYRKIGKKETIDIINASMTEKKTADATIGAIDKSNWTLSVSSKALPSLQTVNFRMLQSKSATTEFDANGILAVGDTISFDYYARYENYTPVRLFVWTIRVDK